MPTDTPDLIDSVCLVCGKPVRGQKVLWEDYIGGRVEEEVRNRVINTHVARSGGHVCGTCGGVLCDKTHKGAVQNAGTFRGYRDSPCPKCGAPLLKGYILAEPPKGASFPSKTGVSEGGAQATAAGAPQGEGSKEILQWQARSLSGDEIAFSCPGCQDPISLPSGLFRNPPPELEGVTEKKQVLRHPGLAKLAALVVGIAVFVLVHRAFFGAEIVIGPALLLPAFAAVFAYTLSFPLLAAFPVLGGKKLPVYGCRCAKCGREALFATDGENLSVQVVKKGT